MDGNISYKTASWVSIFDIMSLQQKYQNRYFIFSNTIEGLRGTTCFIFGILLTSKLLEFRISLKIFTICQVIVGIETMFVAVIGYYPKLIKIFSSKVLSVLADVLKYSNAILYLIIFISLVFIFNFKEKDTERRDIVVE